MKNQNLTKCKEKMKQVKILLICFDKIWKGNYNVKRSESAFPYYSYDNSECQRELENKNKKQTETTRK